MPESPTWYIYWMWCWPFWYLYVPEFISLIYLSSSWQKRFKALSHQALHNELCSPAELCTIKCCGQLKSRKRNWVCETGKWELSFLIALQTRVSAPLRETKHRLHRKRASLSNYHPLRCSIDVSVTSMIDGSLVSAIPLGTTLQTSCMILCH